MLEFLKGTVKSIEIESFVLDIGPVGFEIASSGKTLNGLRANDICTVFTHLIMKEDGISLYGFATKEERRMFILLNSVSGIGPKAAVLILSAFLPGELAMHIIREDIDSLTKVKGIGKKNAGRLILELKDKMKKAAGTTGVTLLDNANKSISSNELSEAYSAMLVLGYTEKDIKGSISRVYKEGMSVEDILKEALKTM
jgi:holliday junction DNA helicase RuvA